MVQSVPSPPAVLQVGQLWPSGRYERPVPLPLGTLRDPAPEQINFMFGELLSGVHRWHPLCFDVGGDSADNPALPGTPGYDREAAS